MSISIKSYEPAFSALSTAAVLPQPSVPMINQSEVEEIISKAMASALFQARDLSNRMISEVEKKLLTIEAPSKILAVEVNGVVNKLTKTAHPCLGRVLVNAELKLNTMLVGPAGCGKTELAHQVAEALNRSFGHVCLTAGASETWLFGRQTANGFIEGTFSKLYRLGGVFLADEMDASDPNLLLAINTALANGSMYNPILGETIPRHPDFVFIGACNTLGRGGNGIYTGRSRLDAATLNRFIPIEVDYDATIEKQVCPDPVLYKLLVDARKKLRKAQSEEVISTRTLVQCYAQFQAGTPLGDILKSLTLGWSEELVEQCGLDIEAFPEPKKAKKETIKEDKAPVIDTSALVPEDMPF